MARSILYIADILEWAKEFHEQHGRWPTLQDDLVAGKDFTWLAVDMALKQGHRGLRGGSSLAILLRNRCGRRHLHMLPAFTIEQILAWADAHYKRTKAWPTEHDGKIAGAPGETWHAVQAALVTGGRGLPGGSTLPQLLAERRGVRNNLGLPRLTFKQILVWADAFHARTGVWPTLGSGGDDLPAGESWVNMDASLRLGLRGLPKGGSLRKLLARRRGVRNPKALPKLSTSKILAWADAHHKRIGHWPKPGDGKIIGAPGETWMAVERALQDGGRGLPGGSSIARLLSQRRGVHNPKGLLPLAVEQILAWADAFHAQTDTWPSKGSGSALLPSGETWANIDTMLRQGGRSLPNGGSLPRLLAQHRGVRNSSSLPSLQVPIILAWADAHYERTGKWPTHKSGPIPEAPGETWGGVYGALTLGGRGFPGGDSLSKLLHRHGRRR